MTIRRAVPGDLESLRDICLRTGDGGADATGRWSDDGLLPDVFLEPYLRYPEGLAWVIDEGSGAAGYLVAVADTRDFRAVVAPGLGRDLRRPPRSGHRARG